MEELVDASLVRGMQVEGLKRAGVEKQLRSWLDLSLNQNVPPALLILSRAFMMSRTVHSPSSFVFHLPCPSLLILFY
jgi:LETM1 and EF-hand domain-containing protein 1